MTSKRLCAAVLAACLVFSANAARAESAAEAYASGRFIEAAALAEQAGGPQRALAARALLAEAVTGELRALGPLLDRAETNARQALAAAPDSVEARLQLALALGLKGRRASIAEAMRKGYAQEGRDLLREAVAKAPREAWAWALIGGWHLEIVRRGGSAGGAYFGASTRAGVAAFEQARRLAPDDAAIAYQYAVTLLALDPERHAGRAAALLADAGACGAGDAFESRMRAKAAEVADILSARGPRAAVAAAMARFGAAGA